MNKTGKQLRTPGNPKQLTNRQHVFPVASIYRFADSKGRVSITHTATGRQFKIKPDHDIFCVFCLWDYRAESGYMRDIENQFQALASEILTSKIVSLTAKNSEVVTKFWALWCMRAQVRHAPEPDRPLQGIIGESLTNEQRDGIEALGASFNLSSGNILPGRFLAGIRIQRGIDESLYRLRGRHWGIVRAHVGEFVAPDSPENMLAVPLSPNVGLYWGHQGCVIPESEVARANQCVQKLAKSYYFARDFSACPGIC